MSAEIKAESGQGWARAAVAVGAVLSVAGNATQTVLTTSPVSLAIRIVLATFLPVIVFIAVEVFVRVAWRPKVVLDFVGRAMLLLLPSFGAAYVSFGHLYKLSRLGGADWIAASASALAIDGLMIGGTVALLAIRAARLAEQLPAPDGIVIPITAHVTERSNVADLAAGTVPGQGGSQPAPVRQPDTRSVLVHSGSGDAPAVGGATSRGRAPRGQTDPALRDAVLALVDDRSPLSVKEAAEKHGVARSTLGRYGTLRTLFRNEPQADVPATLAGKVRTDLVAIVRDAMNRERAL